jgi:hypothetical protein
MKDSDRSMAVCGVNGSVSIDLALYVSANGSNAESLCMTSLYAPAPRITVSSLYAVCARL